MKGKEEAWGWRLEAGGLGRSGSGSGSLKSFTAEHAEGAEKSEPPGAKGEAKTGRGIRQNTYKIRFFQGFPRREYCWGGV